MPKSLGAPEEQSPGNVISREFFPWYQLDRPPFPLVAPDLSRFPPAISVAALPARIRLYISAQGEFLNVEALPDEHVDEDVLEAYRQLFGSVAYVSGRLGEKDVDSYIDIDAGVTEGPSVILSEPLHE